MASALQSTLASPCQAPRRGHSKQRLPEACCLLRDACFASCARSKLKNLRRLEVCGGGVTDAGVAHLVALTRLQHLSLAQASACWGSCTLPVAATCTGLPSHAWPGRLP